jgi:hypothetical protein
MLLDILASDITQVGQSDFVADPNVADLAVNNTGANGLDFFDGRGAFKFQLGDNVLLRKIWCVIPWGFGGGGIAATTYLHLITLGFWNGAAISPLPGFVGPLVIPPLCDPLDFGSGVLVTMPTTGNQRSIRLSDIKLRVSQINIPTVLENERIPVQYYLEVVHNLPMAF